MTPSNDTGVVITDQNSIVCPGAGVATDEVNLRRGLVSLNWDHGVAGNWSRTAWESERCFLSDVPVLRRLPFSYVPRVELLRWSSLLKASTIATMDLNTC